MYQVSLFRNYSSIIPQRQENLWKWLLEKNEYTPMVDRIRSTTDENERKRLKSSLPAITPSGIFSERRANKLIAHSGLICIDIDGKDNPNIMDMEELKKELSSNDHILYCGLSVSGNGLFCLIPIAYPEQHKGHFYALQKDFKDMGIVIDGGCSDVGRLRGYSSDENPHVNPEALLYEKTMEGSIKVKYVNNSKQTTQKQQLIMKQQEGQQSHQIQQNQFNDPLSRKKALFKPTNLEGIKVKADSMSKTQKVRKLIDYIVTSQKDITYHPSDWFTICWIIKCLFDEKEGRRLFHEVSRFYPRYTFEEADPYFSNCHYLYPYNSDRMFEIAAKYGVEVDCE
jgi:hypothetical protein